MNDLEKRLQEVLDAYGASYERWPAEEREALRALLARSEKARALRNEAARLDSLLDVAREVIGPSSDLADRILERTRGPRTSSRLRRWAPILPIAAAAAFALWIARNPVAPSAPSKSIEIAAFDLGAYTTPTDVLLSLDGFDPLAGVPGYDCEDSGLGCVDLGAELDGTERRSMQGETRRMKT